MNAESLHRRLFGLALLLTGRPDRARVHAREVAATTRRRRGPLTMAPGSADRLERQILLACRRDRPAAAGGVEPAFERLEGLPLQFREAFVLVRVLGRSLREAARAMDCSRTAVRRHLSRADAAVLAAAALQPEPGEPASRPSGEVLAGVVSELRGALRRAAAGPVAAGTAVDPRRRTLRRLVIAAAIVAAMVLAWQVWGRLTAPAEPPARVPATVPATVSDPIAGDAAPEHP